MPTQGQQKAWKWLVGFALAIAYGLTAAAASVAQTQKCDCVPKFTSDGCTDYAIHPERGGVCGKAEASHCCVTIEVKSVIVDCELDIDLQDLPTRGKFNVILKGCKHIQREEGLAKDFLVDMADVKRATLLLNKCAIPECPEIKNAWSEKQTEDDFENFEGFLMDSLPPERVLLQHSPECELCDELALRYDKQVLSDLCEKADSGFVAVIGYLKNNTPAIAMDGSRLDVSKAFTSGAVKCP